MPALTGDPSSTSFTRYQVLVIAMLAFIQFTVILDFMVMAPLGAILMPALGITPAQFSHVVSAYAFAAGIAGLLAAGFADRYDRKKLLLFFYVGFLFGTLCCGLAQSYAWLLAARIITGAFGGVISAVAMAIISDVFEPGKRGRVMGYVQMAFAASQVLGIPIGLLLANHWDWHAPYLLIAGVGILAGLFIVRFMRPVAGHLHLHVDTDPWQHLWRTLIQPRYLLPFLTVAILSTGGFMMMPFATTFLVNNVGITEAQLPLIFFVTGLCSMVTFPAVGRLSDSFGRLPTFAFGTLISVLVVAYYSNLGPTAVWLVIVINAVMFVGIGSRMVSWSALMTEIPTLKERGAFMSLTSSIRQLGGGLAASLAGIIVVQRGKGPLGHYDILGYTCCAAMLLCWWLVGRVNRQAGQLPHGDPVPAMAE
jgi:predicted MFS family arabinose efflux permease